MSDWICQDAGPGRVFAVFNAWVLSTDPVSDIDISPCQVPRRTRYAAEAWSAGCDWYFVVTPLGIVLARPGDTEGRICRKLSWRFITAFIEAPAPRKRAKRMRENPTVD